MSESLPTEGNDKREKGIGSTLLNALYVVCIVIGLIWLANYSRQSSRVKEELNAQTLLWEGKYDEAIAAFTVIIKREPKWYWPYNGRGESYRRNGDLVHAIVDLNESIRLKPDFYEAHYSRCRAFQTLGDLDRALADCVEASKLKPDEWVAQALIGKLLLSRGEFDRALEAFGDTIKRQPNSSEAYFYRGQILLFHLDQPAEAAEDFAKAAKAAFDYRDVGLVLGAQVADGVKTTDLMAYEHAFMPDGIYLIIWNHIARARAGQNDLLELTEHAEQLALPIRKKLLFEKFGKITEEAQEKSLEPWPGAIFGLFRDRSTPYLVRRAAEAPSDPELRRKRLCDADFYLGEYYLEKGNRDDARKLLQAAADGCPDSVREGAFAKAELKRLGM